MILDAMRKYKKEFVLVFDNMEELMANATQKERFLCFLNDNIFIDSTGYLKVLITAYNPIND